MKPLISLVRGVFVTWALVVSAPWPDPCAAEVATPGDTESNLREARELFTRNQSTPGIHTTDSGLQYQVLMQGTGHAPGPHSTVTFWYDLGLPDGTTLKSARATLPVETMIPGLRAGLLLMREGEESRLFLQPELAYGDTPGSPVPPNKALIYTITLIKVSGDTSGANEPKEESIGVAMLGAATEVFTSALRIKASADATQQVRSNELAARRAELSAEQAAQAARQAALLASTAKAQQPATASNQPAFQPFNTVSSPSGASLPQTVGGAALF